MEELLHLEYVNLVNNGRFQLPSPQLVSWTPDFWLPSTVFFRESLSFTRNSISTIGPSSNFQAPKVWSKMAAFFTAAQSFSQRPRPTWRKASARVENGVAKWWKMAQANKIMIEMITSWWFQNRTLDFPGPFTKIQLLSFWEGKNQSLFFWRQD